MSCISSNFSSFFLDSLNDPSEFAKYLSNANADTKVIQSYDEFQYINGNNNNNNNNIGGMITNQINTNLNNNSDISSSLIIGNNTNNNHSNIITNGNNNNNNQQQQHNIGATGGVTGCNNNNNNNIGIGNSGNNITYMMETGGIIGVNNTMDHNSNNNNNGMVSLNSRGASGGGDSEVLPIYNDNCHTNNIIHRQHNNSISQHIHQQSHINNHPAAGHSHQQQQQPISHNFPEANLPQHQSVPQIPIIQQTTTIQHHPHQQQQQPPTLSTTSQNPHQQNNPHQMQQIHHHHHPPQHHPHNLTQHQQTNHHNNTHHHQQSVSILHQPLQPQPPPSSSSLTSTQQQQQYDSNFEFTKFLKHSEYGERIPPNHLIDLDTSNHIQPKRAIVVSSKTIVRPGGLPVSPLTTHNLNNSNLTNNNNNNNNINTNNNINNNNNNNNNSSNLMDIEPYNDHDSKNLYDLHNNESNSTGALSTIDLQIARTSTSSSNASDCGNSDNSNQHNINGVIGGGNNNNNNGTNVGQTSSSSPTDKPLLNFLVKENFETHPAHKVEEGIFQHMNKLPNKKKENLKTLGVTFTGHMNVADKSIIVENFARFAEDYAITDHRPFLALNQSGMLKAEQIKFARFLGQGLPNFTLFCIYSNFKNLFCLKRFENYSKGSYNLQYILDKTRNYLTSTSADLKAQNKLQDGEPPPPQQQQQSNKLKNKNNGILLSTHQQQLLKQQEQQNNPSLINKNEITQKVLEKFQIFENYDVHESHRIEDGIFTHVARLSPKKQEVLKQFGIQSNQNVTYYEKHMIIENFIKFCDVYKINDHRPFLDFNESGCPKMEQIKFARYLGQGLPNLTLYKIYGAFKEILALNRIEKLIADGYDLQLILKKKKKNLYTRMHSAANREAEAAKLLQQEQMQQEQIQQKQQQQEQIQQQHIQQQPPLQLQQPPQQLQQPPLQLQQPPQQLQQPHIQQQQLQQPPQQMHQHHHIQLQPEHMQHQQHQIHHHQIHPLHQQQLPPLPPPPHQQQLQQQPPHQQHQQQQPPPPHHQQHQQYLQQGNNNLQNMTAS